MFGLFKSDPTKKLKKQHEILMKKAVDAQRNGNMALFANLSSEAEEIYKKIKELEAKKSS
jgi:hypothetical protein